MGNMYYKIVFYRLNNSELSYMELNDKVNIK